MNHSRPRITHVINKISPESIPLEVAEGMETDRFDVSVVVYYETQEEVRSYDGAPGIHYHGIGAGHTLDPTGPYRLYHQLKTLSPDLIHTHHTLSGSLSRIIGSWFNVPVLNTEHNDHEGFTFGQNMINGLTLGLSDHIICNSNNTKSSFRGFEKALTRNVDTSVIYNGVNLDWIDRHRQPDQTVLDEYGVDPSSFLVGNVASLIEQKNHPALVRAFKQFLVRQGEGTLILAGEGAQRKKIERLVRRLQLSEHVLLTGQISRTEVYKLLHVLDVFVMISHWEGFCNAMVEAMAAGLPVVASSVEPLPEVAGPDALYAGPGNVDRIASHLERLYKNPSYRRETGQSLRERARHRYGLETNIRAYQNLYTSHI